MVNTLKFVSNTDNGTEHYREPFTACQVKICPQRPWLTDFKKVSPVRFEQMSKLS